MGYPKVSESPTISELQETALQRLLRILPGHGSGYNTSARTRLREDFYARLAFFGIIDHAQRQQYWQDLKNLAMRDILTEDPE